MQDIFNYKLALQINKHAVGELINYLKHDLFLLLMFINTNLKGFTSKRKASEVLKKVIIFQLPIVYFKITQHMYMVGNIL